MHSSRRAVLVGLILLSSTVVLVGAVVAQQTDDDVVLIHEPIPTGDGLMAGLSSEPVFVIEEGADPSGLPRSITRDGVSLAPPPPDGGGTGQDLLYRTASRSGQPGPGTVHNVQREVRPDTKTGKEPWLQYHAVFDPAVIPFKRNSAKDGVTAGGALRVRRPELQPLQVVGNRAHPGREVFWGSFLVELQKNVPIPMPSVAPSSRILSYETVPDVPLVFFKDGADNFYAEGGEFEGRVRVNFVMDAPRTWFVRRMDPEALLRDVPDDLRPTLPNHLARDAKDVLSHIGTSADDGYARALGRLVYWFRDYVPGDLPEPRAGESLYRQLALARKGVCRHRSYAFVITAHALGIPARYVSNEAHVFVEVWVPGADAGWLRIDLGGGAAGMDVRNGGRKTRHTVDGNDPFGIPPGYLGGYSRRAQNSGAGAAGGDPVRGLPPSAGRAGATGAPRAAGTTTGTPRSLWGRGRPLPASTGDRRETTTTIDRSSATVYRGDKLRITGRVQAGDKAVVNGPVRVNLMDRRQSRILQVLGNGLTNDSGEFDLSVVMPMATRLGTWEIVVEFIGDKEHEPSHSR